MKPTLLFAALSWLVSWSGVSLADEPVRVNDLRDNVKARLVGVKIGQGRAALLIAKFETIDESKREIEIVFPAHSFTTHEATLKAIIMSSSDWGGAADSTNWGRVKGEVIFSMPKKGAHFISTGGAKSLDHCYLVSLNLEASK